MGAERVVVVEPTQATVHDLDEQDRAILRQILEAYERGTELPKYAAFRVKNEASRERIDRLEGRYLHQVGTDRVGLTIEGLRACDTAEAERMFERINALAAALKRRYRADLDVEQKVSILSGQTGLSAEEIRRLAGLLNLIGVLKNHTLDAQGWVTRLSLRETILDLEPLVWRASVAPGGKLRLVDLTIDGYRPFASFAARLDPLTVIIGANAAGKSALFGALELLKHLAVDALPPEIDPFLAPGAQLFHIGPEGAARAIELGLGLTSGEEPLTYRFRVAGSVGSPRVESEALERTSTERPYSYLSFVNGVGQAKDPSDLGRPRAPWTVKANELALRRVDPGLRTANVVRDFLTSWGFYRGFDVGPEAPMRAPTVVEQEPVLASSGANLVAVVHTICLEHPDTREELEGLLAAAVPGFVGIGASARGKGSVVLSWRERGLSEPLTSADLSDGTLRLLGWLVLALGPNPPPLMCIDEPELGLHPRTLPILAGAFRRAAERTQLLIATHSPYFLSQFELDEIAVMRREDGRSVWRRPASQEALKREVEELGADAIAKMHISDELEARS